MIKFCSIGCGGHASTAHGPSQKKALAARSDLNLAACCDLDAEAARSYAKAFGFRRHYSDIGTMLKAESPDAVALIVPTHHTARLSIPILESGLPLFLEKPPGLNLAELDQLVAAEKRGGGINQVAFNRRYSRVLTEVRAILDQTLAPDQVLQINYEMIRNDRRDYDFSTTAIHAIDAVHHLARSPYSRFDFSYKELPHLGPGVTTITMDGYCESGTQIHMNFQPVAGGDTESGSIHGIDHTICFDVIGQPMAAEGKVDHWAFGTIKDTIAAKGDRIETSGIYDEFISFLDAVSQRRPACPRVQDCRQQVALMEAIRQRSRSVEFAPELSTV
jgi:myo-inositol 2-dehydrogenase / D-chiro-inositol 1-dehydrogenase